MWLENLKEIKSVKGLSVKQIADMTNLPERTVNRVFNGETENPSVDTLHRITAALDASLDDILADTNAVVGSKTLAKAQEEIKALTDEVETLKTSCAVFEAENTALKTSVELLVGERNALANEVAVLRERFNNAHEQLDSTRDALIEAQKNIIKAQNYFYSHKEGI